MNDFDNIFKSSIDPYEENPSEEIWSRIENKLDKEEAAKYKRKYLMLFRLAVCFILFFCASILYDVLINNNRETELIKTANTVNPVIAETEQKKGGDLKDDVLNKNLKTAIVSVKEKISGANIFSAAVLKNEKEILTADNIANYERPPQEQLLAAADKAGEDHETKPLIHDEEITAKPVNIISENLLMSNEHDAEKITKSRKANTPGRFSLTAFFSPDIAGSNLRQEYDYGDENKTQICEGEKSRFSFTTGALAQYQLSNKWALQSGLTFSVLTTSIAPKTILAKQDADGNIKFQIPTSYGIVNVKNPTRPSPQVGDTLKLTRNSFLQLHYFTLPFLFKYKLAGKGKFDLNASFGGGINIITDADMEVMLPVNSNEIKESVRDIEGIKKSNYSAMLGVEALYHCNKKISFSIQPMLRYSVNSLNKDVPVKSSPYTIGFMAGATVPL